jgi:hypothetical protein
MQLQDAGAIFNPTQTYRYSLWRVWEEAAPRIGFVMLNPSTADASYNDPTIRRCIGLAQAWGYGALKVVNLFAYCTTQPIALRQNPDPIGQENDRHLLEAASWADKVVVAWGNWGSLYERDRTVLGLLTPGRSLYCLGINQSGQPRHPLYVSRYTLPIQFPAQIDSIDSV